MLALLSLAAALAQSVNVNVMPLRDVLPPQVMYYLSNPGQYFNITVQNPSTEAQQIFFGAELRQVTPASGLEVVVPAKTMPRQPIEVGAGATRVLTAAEMRTMFNHVRSSDVSMPSNLFSDVTSGSFGNLPEGTYEIIINAYQWNPNTPTPVLISNPALSRTMFRVCYQAKAPEWLMPVSTGDFENRDIATLVKQTPILTWTAPQVNCDPKPRNYTYDLKIVQQMPLQDPLEAIERNPVVYQSRASPWRSVCCLRALSTDYLPLKPMSRRSRHDPMPHRSVRSTISISRTTDAASCASSASRTIPPAHPTGV